MRLSGRDRDTGISGAAESDAASDDADSAVRPDPGAGVGPEEPADRGDTTAGPARAARWSRPSTVGLLTFLLVATALILRNRFLFHDPQYEVGDAAANSLLVRDAKHFHLLVGHYSRIGFNHPGPALMYIQAAGEWLFTDVLGITPAPWNGQAVMLLLLASLALALTITIVHAWTGRWSVSLAALAVPVAVFGHHQFALSSWWEPDLAQPLFLLLLVAAASVASGRVEHVPFLLGIGGLLIHAHVQFVAFVTVIGAGALLALVLTQGGPRAVWRTNRRPLLVGAAVAAVFLSTIVLNTLLHWPGEIHKYVSYSGGSVHPSPGGALRYARQFWEPQSTSWGRVVPFLYVIVAALSVFLAPRPLRRTLGALFATCLLAEVLFVAYAFRGIDDLGQAYVGDFSRAIPIGLLLVMVVGLGSRLAALGPRLSRVPVVEIAVGVIALAVGLTTLARSDDILMRPAGLADLPQAIAAVQQATAGHPVVVHIVPGAGAGLSGSGLLLGLERHHVKVCQDDPALKVFLTPHRLCTPEQARAGVHVVVTERGTAPHPIAQTLSSDMSLAP